MTDHTPTMSQKPIPDHIARRDFPPDHYLVSEVFLSTQGEGVNAGVVMVFVRFARCNLRCSRRNAGFDCDTDFETSRTMSRDELMALISTISKGASWVLLTGGEPLLQVDEPLLQALKSAGYSIAVESNGTVKAPGYGLIDHLTISPKSAWHTIAQRSCHELRLVRAAEQALISRQDLQDRLKIFADYLVVSPAFLASGEVDHDALAWCQGLVLQHPEWRLSVQLHKLMGVR